MGTSESFKGAVTNVRILHTSLSQIAKNKKN